MGLLSFFTTSELPTGMHRIGWRGGASHNVCSHMSTRARGFGAARRNADETQRGGDGDRAVQAFRQE